MNKCLKSQPETLKTTSYKPGYSIAGFIRGCMIKNQVKENCIHPQGINVKLLLINVLLSNIKFTMEYLQYLI
jgi:hypothetical protein